jgi:t-SNARE complex subunit (syntaxin)
MINTNKNLHNDESEKCNKNYCCALVILIILIIIIIVVTGQF